MQTNDYFKNLEKYWSANFLAFMAFFNFLFVLFVLISATGYDDICSIIDFIGQFVLIFLLGYILNIVMLGFVIFYTIFPMSLLYFFLLNSTKKKTMIISLSTSLLGVLLFICFFYFRENYRLDNLYAISQSLGIYSRYHNFFSFIAISIPVLCILDKQKKSLVPNTFLTSNKIYEKFVHIFFYYFWVIYIPFLIGLLICST